MLCAGTKPDGLFEQAIVPPVPIKSILFMVGHFQCYKIITTFVHSYILRAKSFRKPWGFQKLFFQGGLALPASSLYGIFHFAAYGKRQAYIPYRIMGRKRAAFVLTMRIRYDIVDFLHIVLKPYITEFLSRFGDQRMI